MVRFCLFVAAVGVLYIGGFVYEQIGPVFYGLIVTLIASTPLLLKISFWKKIILMVPLLVLRVVGKIFLIVFGKNALSKVLAKYGLLEKRYNQVLKTFEQSKNQSIGRWTRLSRSSQAYLLLIFFPVALVVFIIALLIKIVRLRFLQFMIEKLMQNYLMKWSLIAQAKIPGAKLPESQLPGSKIHESSLEDTPEKESQCKDSQTDCQSPGTLPDCGNVDDITGDR